MCLDTDFTELRASPSKCYKQWQC